MSLATVAPADRVGPDAHKWTAAARAAHAAAGATTRLRREVGDSEDPAVAAELVVQEAQEPPSAMLRVLAQNPLRRLEGYDARTCDEIVASLRAWCSAGLDVQAAAAALHVHPETPRHRIGRAAEISGLHLVAPRHLLALQLLL